MSINRPLKVGDKLRLAAKPNKVGLFESAVVKGLDEADGEGFLWLLAKRPNGTESLLTFTEQIVMDHWELVPDFFIEGEVYTYSSRGPSVPYRIEKVYEIDNPVSTYDHLLAVAEGTNSVGKKWITILDTDAFTNMTKLEKW